MRAWTLTAPAPIERLPLQLAEHPLPVPGPGQVRVAVRACGVCRTDLHVVEGDLAVRRQRVIPGHQVVGVVDALGEGASGLVVGERVGVAWLHSTCGTCRFCGSHRENLCERAEFTGWTIDGGFAEFCVAPATFCYPLPGPFGDLQAAPLLCAGIIGYRALRLCGLLAGDAAGARLGIYGFGAAGHVAIQIARAHGIQVYVATRDQQRHRALAKELGAVWTGASDDIPPVPLDAAILFAPAGSLVPVALRALDKGGRLVLGGIHMSPVPELPYELLYDERVVRSVANNTRADGRLFLAEAAQVPVRTQVQAFPFDQVPEALRALKHDAVRGAAVITMAAANTTP
jgi:propanol-preferring alcohol dehydrogenase